MHLFCHEEVRVSVRAFLMTLAVGLFAASVVGRLSSYFSEVPVDLPKTVSDSPIIVIIETERNRWPRGGGGG
jgi:hypothetical protein